MSTEKNSSSAPPIGVSHLLVLTACVGFVLAIQLRAMESMRATFSEQSLELFQFCFMVGGSLTDGLALAGLFWLLDWRRRRGRFHLQPGHWLIIFSGVTLLVTSATQLLLRSLISNNWPNNDAIALMMGPSVLQLVVSLFVLGLAVVWTGGVWRCLMVSLLLKSVLDSLLTILVLNGTSWSYLNWLYYAALVFQIVPILLLIAAVIRDFFRKHRRDWIHYCGVILPVASLLAQVGTIFYYRLFSP